MRPTRLHVDLDAIVANAATTQAAAGAQALCAVIKADAYGHGAAAVGRALRGHGVALLAVALVEEARALRQAGILGPIVVLGADYRGSYDAIVSLALTPMVGEHAEVDALNAAAERLGRTLDVHLELDSGMARLGAQPTDVVALARHIARSPALRLTALMTHFSHADVVDSPVSRQQVAQLEQAFADVRVHVPTLTHRHVVSSGAVVTAGYAPHEWVRCGLTLYGVEPVPSAPLGLLPAARWVTRPVSIRTILAGQPVSYGATWRAARPSRIATLPVGYADGYPRLLSNRAQVLIAGQRVPLVGSVCMDLCMVDVTDVAEVSLADEVVLMGQQGDAEIGASELAGWAQTIPYEILVGIGPRVPRDYGTRHGH